MIVDEIKKIKSTKKDLKNFGITIAVFLFIVVGLLFYLNQKVNIYLLSIGFVFFTFGLLFPIVLKPLYMIWMAFAVVFGWVMTRIILSALFFFIITPIGIFTRLIGKDFLFLKHRDENSYWNKRDRTHEINQNYEKQF